MNTLTKQRGVTVFEAGLGLVVVLVISGISVAHFKDAKGRLSEVDAMTAMPANYRNITAPTRDDKGPEKVQADAVACDLRVQGSCP